MASHGQTQDDYVGASSMQNDNADLFTFDYSGTDVPIHFPFSRPQIYPSPVENLYGYPQNFSSGSVHDLDMVTNVYERNRYPLNNPVDWDVVMRNNISMLDNQVFSFPNVGVDMISSGIQTSNNMMSAYQGVNRVPHFENIHGSNSIITNTISANSNGDGQFHMSALDSETQNRAEINRTFTNFSSEPKLEQTILPRVSNNQVRVHSSQLNSEDKLDGRFLSLGYQGEVASYMNSYGGKASHHIGDTSFSSQCQMINSSFNNVRGGVAGFENNVGGAVTALDCVGNQTLSGDDYYGLQAMTSGFDLSPISNVDEGQVNMYHYIPTPSTISLESGIKSDSIIDSSDPSEYSGANVSQYDDGSSRVKKRRTQRVPFNSSVLRSNHQIAAEPQQNSPLSTKILLPHSGTNIGESDSQAKSGLALGFDTARSGVQTIEDDHLHRSNRLLPSGQFYPPFPVFGRPSTGQGADIPINQELSCASSSVKCESLKRTINLPRRATTQNQRRKVLPQSSVQQYSPDLLQNALGHIATGHSTPVIPSSVKAVNIPTAVMDFASSGWPRNTLSLHPAEGTTETSKTAMVPQHPTSTAAFVPPIHIPPTYTTTQYSPASLADPSTISAVSIDSLPPVSLPVITPPVALARTIASRSGSSRIPIPATSTKRVATANIPPAAHRLSSAIAPRRSNLLHTRSVIKRPVRTDWKKSLPAMAGLAKMDPAFRASQVLGSMSHIKWQGFDTPPTIGFKCMICNRDLSFTPDGPVIQPPIPPPVAVLPCGHTFHDQCLLLITPEDQLKDPPCIPCAVEN